MKLSLDGIRRYFENCPDLDYNLYFTTVLKLSQNIIFLPSFIFLSHLGKVNKVLHFPRKVFETEFLNFSLCFFEAREPHQMEMMRVDLNTNIVFLFSHSYRNTDVASRPIPVKCSSSAFLFVEVVPHNQGLVLLETNRQILLRVARFLHVGDECVQILLTFYGVVLEERCNFFLKGLIFRFSTFSFQCMI